MAETFSTFNFETGNDQINYSSLPDVQSQIDIISVAYRNGDIALKHGKRSEPFTATFTAFSDDGGETAKTKYDNLLALQGSISTLTTWQGAYSNVLLERVEQSQSYDKVIIGGAAADRIQMQLTFRKMQ